MAEIRGAGDVGGLWMLSLAPAGSPYPTAGPRSCATQQADDLAAGPAAAAPTRLPRREAGQPAPRARWRTTAATYTLPVVVHVIYHGEAVGTGSNISQAQVQSQLDVLNEDYRNLNPDGTQVPAPFQPLRADAQFQFVLALRDPAAGRCPSRVSTAWTAHAQGFAARRPIRHSYRLTTPSSRPPTGTPTNT